MVPQVVYLVFLVIVISSQTSSQGLRQHEARLGSDTRVLFSHRLTQGFTIQFGIYNLHSALPFCDNGTMQPEALLESQRDRFDVTASLDGQTFTLITFIKDLRVEDKGVYVTELKVFDKDGVQKFSHILDVYLMVFIPLTKAECNIHSLAFSTDWKEVRCSAEIGSGGTGIIFCYQNSELAFLQESRRSNNNISASYWMDASYSISCCSSEEDHRNATNCTDFTYMSGNHGNEDHVTSASASGSSMEQGLTSQVSTETNPVVPSHRGLQIHPLLNDILTYSILALIILLLLIVLVLHCLLLRHVKKNRKTECC